MKYYKFVIMGALAIAGAGCLNIAVKSPDGQSTATYQGTSIIGGENISCGTLMGVTSCQGSGQNVAGLAQAIAPYLWQAGVAYPVPPAPAPTATSTTTQTPAPIETPVH